MGHGYFRSNRQVLEDISAVMAGRDHRDTVAESDEHNRCPENCSRLVAAGGCKPLQRLGKRQFGQVVKRLLPTQVLQGEGSTADDDSGGGRAYMVAQTAVEVVCEPFELTDSAAGLGEEQAAEPQAGEGKGQQLEAYWEGTYAGAGRYVTFFA